MNGWHLLEKRYKGFFSLAGWNCTAFSGWTFALQHFFSVSDFLTEPVYGFKLFFMHHMQLTCRKVTYKYNKPDCHITRSQTHVRCSDIHHLISIRFRSTEASAYWATSSSRPAILVSSTILTCAQDEGRKESNPEDIAEVERLSGEVAWLRIETREGDRRVADLEDQVRLNRGRCGALTFLTIQFNSLLHFTQSYTIIYCLSSYLCHQ